MPDRRLDASDEVISVSDGRSELRHVRHAAAVAAGAAVLGICILLLGDSRLVVPTWERHVLEVVNGLPDALGPILYVEMQLGAFWAIPVVALGLLISGRRRAAAAAVMAGVLAWMVAKAVKGAIGRGRPADLLVDVHLREAHVTGLGFVSGHTAISFALATVLTPYLHGRWRVLPFALAALVGFARVYVGAHLPLDVLGGAGLGVSCGSLASWIIGGPDPAPWRPAVRRRQT